MFSRVRCKFLDKWRPVPFNNFATLDHYSCCLFMFTSEFAAMGRMQIRGLRQRSQQLCKTTSPGLLLGEGRRGRATCTHASTHKHAHIHSHAHARTNNIPIRIQTENDTQMQGTSICKRTKNTHRIPQQGDALTSGLTYGHRRYASFIAIQYKPNDNNINRTSIYKHGKYADNCP